MTRHKSEFFQTPAGTTLQEAWKQAKLALADAPDGTKFSRKASPNTHNLSFIKLHGKVYALSHTTDSSRPHYLGRGNYGKVKYIMDEDNQIHVVKIETTNDPFQQMETRVAQTLGLVVEDKQKQADKEKYYTVMLNLGNNLSSYFRQNPQISPALRFDLAAQICLQVFDLHEQFIHRDIKPDNLVIDEAGFIRLIDFGLAEALNEKGELDSVEGFLREGVALDNESKKLYNERWTIGTPAFLPGTAKEIVAYQDKKDATLPSRMQKLGHIGCDNTAVKRVLFNENGNSLFNSPFLATLPELLFELIRKNNVVFASKVEKETRDETKKMASVFIFIRSRLLDKFASHQIEESKQNLRAYKELRVSGELYQEEEIEQILNSPSRQDELITLYRRELEGRISPPPSRTSSPSLYSGRDSLFAQGSDSKTSTSPNDSTESLNEGQPKTPH